MQHVLANKLQCTVKTWSLSHTASWEIEGGKLVDFPSTSNDGELG